GWMYFYGERNKIGDGSGIGGHFPRVLRIVAIGEISTRGCEILGGENLSIFLKRETALIFRLETNGFAACHRANSAERADDRDGGERNRHHRFDNRKTALTAYGG